MKHRNKGQEMLAGLRDSRAEIAAKSGAAPSQLCYWINGERLPGLKWRPILRETYGIPEGAWDLAPGEEDLSQLPLPPDVSGSPTFRPPARAALRTTSPGVVGTLAEVTAHLAELRTRLDTEQMTVSERTKLSTVYTQTLNAKSRLERDVEMQENRIVREHPAWKAIKESIFATLAPYPDIARKVAENIAEALGRDVA